jgi:phosphopantetheinyl transferase (holo-ACP synthase)
MEEHNNFLTAKERKRLENRKKLDEKRAKEFAEKGQRMKALEPAGTVVGNKQRMQMFKDKLLGVETGNSMINKLIHIALDDEHDGQMAALKMCMDRMLPVSYFEEKRDSGRTQITISISGIGDNNTEEGNIIDGESSLPTS